MNKLLSPIAQRKNTKIVATLGPASNNYETIYRMIHAGLNVIRINFSHADHTALPDLIYTIRRAARELNAHVGILGDLRGPRIRVGVMDHGAIELAEGSEIILTPEELSGTPEKISISFADLAGDVEIDSRLLLDDGNLELVVMEKHDDKSMRCRITRGGKLSSKRGINVPGCQLSIPAVTEKDYKDVDLAIHLGFDFLALSFVQAGEDVNSLRHYMYSAGAADIPLISKVENRAAIDNINEIVEASDGVMVARGDLALEVNLQDVPVAQKHIIGACRQAAKPVITATQMLETMTQAHKPTRAEVADVANAVLDGTDAVMLSGESAIGKHPVKVVQTMAEIAVRAEQAWRDGELPMPAAIDDHQVNVSNVVAHATYEVADRLNAAAMLIYSTKGSTVKKIACHRPEIPIIALCPGEEVLNRMSLCWGVHAREVEFIRGTAHMVEVAISEAQASGYAKAGDVITITAGTPFGRPGSTNLLNVEIIPIPQVTPDL